MKPSNVSGCFVAAREEERLFRFTQLAYSCRTISGRVKFILASVSMRQIDVRITVVEIPYNIRSLYVVLDVRTTSVDVGANFGGSRLGVVVRFEIVVSAYFVG